MCPEPSDKQKASSVVFQRQRKLSRMLAIQFLFQTDVRNEWEPLTEERLALFRELAEHQPDPNEEEKDENAEVVRDFKHSWNYAEKLIRGVLEYRAEIDELIVKAAANWSLTRMGSVDRTILRIGTFEITKLPNLSAATAINEAVELAKSFGQPDSPRFINGVLDKIRKTTEQPQA